MTMPNECIFAKTCKECTCNQPTKEVKAATSRPYFGESPNDLEEVVTNFIDRQTSGK